MIKESEIKLFFWGVLSILDRVTLGGLPPFSVVFIGKNCWGNIPYG
jgi:hypothetical protein